MLNDVIIRYNRVYEGWKRDEIGEHFVRTLGSPRSDMNDWLSLGRGMPVEQNWSSSRLQTCECFASDHIDMYTREWGFTFCIVDVILYIKRPDPNRNDPAFVQGLADLQLSRGPLKWWRGGSYLRTPYCRRTLATRRDNWRTLVASWRPTMSAGICCHWKSSRAVYTSEYIYR